MESWERDLCNFARTAGFIAEEFCSSLYEVSGGGNVETFADQGFKLKNMLAVVYFSPSREESNLSYLI